MIFGNLGNMGEMLKMAREMQGQLKKVKDELAREIYEGSTQGVIVKVRGDMEFEEIKINPQVVDPNNISRLEKEIQDATGKALKAARDAASVKMKGLTGGLGLPGMF